MCVQVQVVKPPKPSDVLFNNKVQVKEQNQKQEKEAGKSRIRKINHQGQINERTTGDQALQNSLNLYPDPYCDMVSKMPTACLEWSILELWGHEGVYDEYTDAEIASLTQESILDKVNNVTKSGIFLQDKSFADYLGDKIYNDEGRIIGAKATVIRWFGRLNTSEALIHPVRERDELIDQRTLDFEGEMLKVLLNQTGYPAGLESYPNVQRSFGDVAISSIFG